MIFLTLTRSNVQSNVLKSHFEISFFILSLNLQLNGNINHIRVVIMCIIMIKVVPTELYHASEGKGQSEMWCGVVYFYFYSVARFGLFTVRSGRVYWGYFQSVSHLLKYLISSLFQCEQSIGERWLPVFEKALRSTYFSEATRWDIAAMTENKRSPIPTSAWHSHCSNTLKKQVSEFQILSRPI
jgi:hypothetical protein